MDTPSRQNVSDQIEIFMDMAKKRDRYYISNLGEYYDDCLKVEASLKARSKAFEGSSLLCSALMKREANRDKMVSYLAEKHGMTHKEMWDALRDGTFKPSVSEVEEIETIDGDEDES